MDAENHTIRNIEISLKDYTTFCHSILYEIYVSIHGFTAVSFIKIQLLFALPSKHF